MARGMTSTPERPDDPAARRTRDDRRRRDRRSRLPAGIGRLALPAALRLPRMLRRADRQCRQRLLDDRPGRADRAQRASLSAGHADPRDGPHLRPSGTIRLTDFMPVRSDNPVAGAHRDRHLGKVDTRIDAALRFDYGNMPPWVTRSKDGVVMHVGPDKVIMRGSEDLQIEDSKVFSRFTTSRGQPPRLPPRLRPGPGARSRAHRSRARRWRRPGPTGPTGSEGARRRPPTIAIATRWSARS